MRSFLSLSVYSQISAFFSFSFYSSVFSENVIRLKSSALGASFSSDLSPILRAQAMLNSELGAVILSVLMLHFAGFFVG